jgi:ABC-type dipeptide/oligopeptide/nickel transport system permease component
VLAFIIRRLITTVVLVLATMLVTFALMRGMGGSPFSTVLEPHAGVPRPVEIDLREFYKLDEPWFVEYATYVKHVFTFEFGPSLVPPARGGFGAQRISVDEVMRENFPVTLQLAGLASLWAIALGIPLGLIAVTNRRSPVDYLASSLATGLLVIPIFLFTTLFARHLVFGTDIFPPGWDSWSTRLLASFTLSLAPIGFVARLIRAAAVETLQEDYVRAAPGQRATAETHHRRPRAAQFRDPLPFRGRPDARAARHRRLLRRAGVCNPGHSAAVGRRGRAAGLPDADGTHRRRGDSRRLRELGGRRGRRCARPTAS